MGFRRSGVQIAPPRPAFLRPDAPRRQDESGSITARAAALDRTETVKKYLEYQDSGQIEPLLELLAEDAVMVYPMRSATGRTEIAEALRSRPGMIKPSYAEIKTEDDRAEVIGILPEGSPFPAVTFRFDFAGDLIKRVEINLG